MQSPASTYVPLRKLDWRIVTAGFTLVFFCFFFYKYLDFVTNRYPYSTWRLFWEEFTGVAAALVLFPLAYLVAIHFPLPARRWKQHLLIQFSTMCTLSLVHTSLMVGVRMLVFPLIGLGRYHFGVVLARYPMEFCMYSLTYGLALSLIYLFHQLKFAHARELQAAQLERNLAQSRLENLRLQLEPHFLFNTLNAISAVIYEDTKAADEMIARLSHLLRELLQAESEQEVTLSRELWLLRLYLDLMQARFEDRLRFTISLADDKLGEARVPQLILQPIVENTIRYGADPLTFNIDLTIRAEQRDSALRLIVEDRGPGLLANGNGGQGVGLRNCRDRLQHLYRDGGRLDLLTGSEGGLRVELTLPLVISAAPAISASAARLPVTV